MGRGSQVIYFFTKSQAYVQCELHPGRPNRLTVLGPGDVEYTERFATADALQQRWDELRTRLVQDGWSGPFGRDARV